MQNFTYLFKRRFLWIVVFMTVNLMASIAYGQSIRVSGIVTAKSDQLPVAGATVTVKGSGMGVATDANGKYTIQANAGSVLVFSAVGYLPFEAKVTFGTLDIVLDSKENNLNEVVVIGYGTTTRQNITTAVAKVSPKNIPQAASNSVPDLLFGRASGLQVQQSSSQPGGAINLSIRGRGTPLYVVDGVVYPNNSLEPSNGSIASETNGVSREGLAGLNADDVESIEVLKDASAAIYGVNAANGVILITTKKGKAGKISVNYSGNYSANTNYPYLQPLNATQYETLFNQFASDYTIGTKPALYTQAQIAAAGTGTNWLDQIFQNGHVNNHELNIAGGSDKATYYFSGSYYNQTGTVKKSGLTRFTGRANLSFNLAKFLTLNTNFTGNSNTYLNSSSGGQTGGSGSQGFGVLQAAMGYLSSIPVYDPATGAYSSFGLTPNPVSLLDIKDLSYSHSLSTNVSADFKIIPGMLSGRLLFGDVYETAKRDFFVPSTTFYFATFQARGSLNYNDRENQTIEATLNFNKDFLDKKIKFDVVGGVGQYKNTYSAFNAQGASSAGGADVIGTDNLSLEDQNLGVSSSKSADKTRSFFGRANFDILDRYLISGSIRYDGYSMFFPQSKYAAFPSVSLGWKINNENFLKDIAAVGLLKLRASIGTTGSTITGAYGGYAPDGNFLFLNQGSTTYVTLARYAIDHPELTWQKTINKNIGVDFELFQHRIAGSVDVYRDDITHLLGTQATAPLDYLGTQPVNGGHRFRSGYDIGITTDNIRGNFNWSSIINVSHYLYKWVDHFPTDVLATYQGFTYQDARDPVNEIYYFKTKGILQPGQTVPATQPTLGGANLPGAPIFLDANGDGKLDGHDIFKLNPDPKIILGFGNTVRYKKIDFTVFLYGQLGGKATNINYLWADPISIVSGSQNGTVQAYDVYSSANPTGTRPGVNYTESAIGLPVGSDINLKSTDFVRCRNLTLGYTFNKRDLKGFANSLRLYVDVQNAFIITNYTGVDPEVAYRGVKGGYAPYPMFRTYSLGIKAGF